MTRADSFMKRGKRKNNQCSSMSNSAWCDLNSEGNILKPHDKCPNSEDNHILSSSLLARRWVD